jgi:flagellar protein FlbD
MILVTRLNGSRFAINPDLIERVQESPDTTIVLVDGATYIVTEALEEVLETVACYRARVVALAHAMQVAGPDPALRAQGHRLELVDGARTSPRSPARRGS